MHTLLNLELAKTIASERQRQAATRRPALLSTRADRVERRALRSARAATHRRAIGVHPNALREDASEQLIARARRKVARQFQ